MFPKKRITDKIKVGLARMIVKPRKKAQAVKESVWKAVSILKIGAIIKKR